MTNKLRHHRFARLGHTIMEMTVAMVASAVLLAGLGSVMMIARQVAYTPSAAARRIDTGDIVNQIAEELRSATLVIQQTPQILEFVVADRDANGTAEKIRYEWSGTPGDPVYKTVNTAPAVAILDSVNAFESTFVLKPETRTLTTTIDSAEAVLIGNTAVVTGTNRSITAANNLAQQIDPAGFSFVPSNAICFNATKAEFYGLGVAPFDESIVIQLRSSGSPNDQPTSQVLGEVTMPESTVSASPGWHTAVFPQPIRGLRLHRKYDLVWGGIGTGVAVRLTYNDSATGGVLETTDSGGTWQFISPRQIHYRLHGTYTTPSTTYNVTRNYVSHVRLAVQSGSEAHSRIDASVPLLSVPELLSAYWRADFNTNPTATNANGDSVSDWALAGGGSFNTSTLINGVWYASGALETRPLSDFATTTVVEARCRNTTTGGNGAVVRINADRQGGLYAPLLVYVLRQVDGTQTLALLGRTSDSATKLLFKQSNLSSDFVRFRLTIVPQSNVVNLQINDEDQGTFAYPVYAPVSASDRYLTLYADTSAAEFDYVDVRTATP